MSFTDQIDCFSLIILLITEIIAYWLRDLLSSFTLHFTMVDLERLSVDANYATVLVRTLKSSPISL